ncbi:dyslexia-associated protein KIAA0319-like [Pectinophora gossypiella]|uniref:dyslexia-associated protein KIAA0319-like n=1 Tax=Pectinophora gossypiella TaxID=13191 RepID=UPI00214EF83E|nr:dyslexia-associated protein KIAA0319-like [Pectinophora gossypiella]
MNFTYSVMNLFILVFLINIKITLSQFNKAWSDKYENNKCPKLYPKNFVNYAPVGNLTAGNYSEKSNLKGLRHCVMGCCLEEVCNVAFIVEDRCYHVECVSDELCLPLPRTNSQKWDSHVSMILVKPVLPNENWSDILDQSNYREVNNNFSPEEDSLYSPYANHRNDIVADDEDSKFLSHFINNLPNIEVDETRNFDRDSADNDLIMDASSFLEKVPCEVGAADDCPFNSECVPLGLKLRNGICKCLPGTEENAQGACIQTMRPFSKGPTIPMDAMKKDDLMDAKADDIKPEIASPKSVQNLTVSIISKQVQLPDNEVTLAAYTIPDEKATNSHYNYIWTLVDQPKGGFTGNMNQNGATVSLTDLTEGQYRFKVTVNSTNYYGVGYANVTVLPRQRINTPPQVVITPQSQTVKLPNSGAVLDGSASKDDDAIISWHWELTSGPIGYQPPLLDGPTLVLNDLKQPGNYTFKLTVEDSDHVKNSTTANITVLNHTDYPPEANAGQDVIIYLPDNTLTLNGSLSTDDHEITSWEWTKSAEDENKAVDMQNTHSPFLQLSNLSEGVYTFVLKVTDSSGQSSTADVHVFVKPPTNTPPIADAGQDVFISLPQTWMSLNGSASHDDHRIVAYTWRCVEGPTNATILGYNESVANATNLTKGQYIFSLTVLDDNGNSASDNVTVTVTQNKNSPPKADAGGDQVLTLPISVLVLNGSKSSDDFRIVSWKWTRAGSGLAAGTVILHSDTQPVLMLTNIEQGRYVFELTVTDDQGESDRDTVSVQVKPDPLEMNLLELTLNIPIWTFTQSQLDSLVQKMTLLLKENVKVNVTEVRGEIDSGNTQIIFFLSEEGKPMEGTRGLALGRAAGTAAGAVRVRSVRCLSTCSGRGVCDRATRACRCDAFWMQSLTSQLDPEAMPDCDWSVVYASLGGVAALCSLVALCCAALRAMRRAAGGCGPRPPRPRTKYRLLPAADHEDRPFATKEISETETDSDVLFESKSKTTSFSTRAMNGEAPQGNGWKKNGLYKGSRKVKT